MRWDQLTAEEKRDAVKRVLAATPDASAREIAIFLGAPSRHAVIGVAYRNKLKLSGPSGRRIAAPTARLPAQSETLRCYLAAEDYLAFQIIAEQRGESASALLRELVRFVLALQAPGAAV
jgi:hypothetical protein